MLERILVPLDGSDVAARALVQARPLLRAAGSETILVHVIDTPGLDATGRDVHLPRLRAEARDRLSQAAEPLKAEGIRVRSIVAEGLPWEQIVETAARERATMIALTTHGRTGLARWAFGSVTEKLVRTSAVPLFVLRSFVPRSAGGLEPASASELSVRKILVPLDGGELGLCALEPAAALARVFRASIILVHVESRFDFPGGTYSARVVDAPSKSPPGPPPSDPGLQLEHAGETLAARGLTVVTMRIGGDASSRICDLPAGLGADAIAMATHGRRGMSRLLLGSVTERVLRESTVPMLVIPPPAASVA